MRVDQLGLTVYLTDYLNEEIDRGAKEITHAMVCNAIEAFEGGAYDEKSYVVAVHEQRDAEIVGQP